MAGCELAREQQHVIDRICPYGQPGDRLWVREATINVEEHGYVGPVYIASEEGEHCLSWGLGPPDDVTEIEPHELRKRPSIHMPRSMSRILLEITAVRVERLNEISEADARAEGVTEGAGDFAGCFSVPGTQAMSGTTAKECYARLWESINGAGSWAANPFCWVIEFRRIAP
jgi:hypothetical protein